MISLIEKLGWKSVSVLNVGGDKYADYMSRMQDRLVFKSTSKFPSNTNDFQSVKNNQVDQQYLFCIISALGRLERERK